MITPLLYFIKQRFPIDPDRKLSRNQKINPGFLREPVFCSIQAGNIIQGVGCFIPAVFLPSTSQISKNHIQIQSSPEADRSYNIPSIRFRSRSFQLAQLPYPIRTHRILRNWPNRPRRPLSGNPRPRHLVPRIVSSSLPRLSYIYLHSTALHLFHNLRSLRRRILQLLVCYDS